MVFPLPRVEVVMCAATAQAVAAAVSGRLLAGGVGAVDVRAVAATITGGAAVITDPALPAGAWQVRADGRLLMEGTVSVCAGSQP